jgi:hypothetical protein
MEPIPNSKGNDGVIHNSLLKLICCSATQSTKYEKWFRQKFVFKAKADKIQVQMTEINQSQYM